MAKISLRMYNREIEGLIEHGQQLDEAIAHCRHILKTYPKHLETYRLLGKAYLEAKRYEQAVDIFQRVLVVTPDDFVSHVGMSIIADDKGKLDDAIWHMERAFEVQPSNAAIQGELQRLFGRRDGVEPPKIRLTRGALAHMYVQGELYTQAISEIRAVLSNDPRRTDMQTLLARAYFKNGQKAEATEICTELLTRFPYCLDANRLMVEILPGTQRADSVQEYKQRVFELDPYAAFAQDSLFHVDTVPDSAVSLERLEYTGEPAEPGGFLGIGLDTDSTAIGHSSDQPGFRRITRPGSQPASTGDALPAWLQTEPDSASPSAPAPAPAPAAQEDLPDFLRQAGWEQSSGAPETPSVFAEPAAEPAEEGEAAVQGDLPDWVKALAPADEAGESVPSAPPTPPASPVEAKPSPEPSTSFSADVPDWLRNLGGEEPAEAAPAEPETSFSAPAQPASEAPDWLSSLRAEAPAEPAAPAGSEEEETPDWLKNLGGRELDEPVAPPKAERDSDWLGSLRSEQPSELPTEATAEESPDWLKDFNNDLETPIVKPTPPESPQPKAAPPAPAPQPTQTAGPAAPAGLGALGTTAQEQDDAMAWLESLAAKHGAKPEELVTDPNARTDVAPDWVDKAKEIGEPAPQAGTPPAAPTAPVEDETGVWLKSLQEESGKASPEQNVPQQPAAEAFDFSSLAEESGFKPAEAEVEKEEVPFMREEETPDWLAEFTSKSTPRADLGEAPDWLRGMEAEEASEPGSNGKQPPESAPEPEAAQPAEASEEAPTVPADLPAWLAGLDKEEAAPPPPAIRHSFGEDLPAWLQADVQEPEPQVTQPANPADWRPIQKAAEPAPSPAEQPVSEVKPVAPEPPPATRPVAQQPLPPAPKPAPPASAPVPRAPAPARPKAAPPPVSKPKPSGSTLADAQSELGRGNIAAALDVYSKLIRKGKSLEEIIRDLRDALYRYPVEVPLWQSLGDAYMRANRLQEALDAYTKAEELLR